MTKKEALEFLRNNPVFWSRLGFCYDPPIKDKNGKPLVFDSDFSYQLKIHDDFSDAGVKIHTCILHSGWVGVNEYDYSLCDRVLESIFESGKAEWFIPRIKLNVPVNWCLENPSEVFVYENGPKTEEEICALVGTPKQDWLGYESEKGYYVATDKWQDERPNVGGLISNQSFSSQKWLEDAGEALRRLVVRLENSKYAEKILAYHICYGACGESMLWGRQNGRFGDYGIANQRHFYDWALRKYGSRENIKKAWGNFDCVIPPSYLREKETFKSEDFYKNETADRHSVDYDIFMTEVNTCALSHFGKIVKDNSGDKPVGAFYGYIIHMGRTPYTGHLGYHILLNDPNIDFFAAPKSYYRSIPGEPGGEMAPTVSINGKKLWVDECDNRTHLTVGDNNSNASDAEETYAVQLREFCKNVSHNSGLWFMDLGGGWYDDRGIMNNISAIVSANNALRKIKHQSRAEIIAVMDEKSVMLTHPNVTNRIEDMLRNFQLVGAPIDIVFSFDIENVDFSYASALVLLTPLCTDENMIANLRKKIPQKTHIIFCGKSDGATDFELIDSENSEYPEFYIKETPKVCPIIRDGDGNTVCAVNSFGDYMISKHGLSVSELRKITELCGVRFYAPEECAVYADNRIVSFFPRTDMKFVPNIPEKEYTNIITGEKYVWGTAVGIKGKHGFALM